MVDRWHSTQDVIGKKFSWNNGTTKSRSGENDSREYEQ